MNRLAGMLTITRCTNSSVYIESVIMILTVAAAETSIGLAILIIYYRLRGTIAIEFINYLKG